MAAPLRHSWRDVRDSIHRSVLDGTYRPGDKLPRDEDIAETLGCARSTVQRAMQDLSDCGIVERKRKGGTHVRADPVSRATLDIPITRREVEARGAHYAYRLLQRSLAQTPAQITATLALPAPEQMLHVQALHLSDRRPYIYEDRWISTRTAPEILDLDLTRHSANEWLVRNKPYSRYDLRLYAIAADAGAADHLDVAPGSALLVIERTTWIEDLPITTVRSVTTPGYQLLAQSGA
jgi:GntR family histidine utilization transcriptional repressor